MPRKYIPTGRPRTGRPPKPVMDRIATKVVVDPDTGCHNWTGTADVYGYGVVREDPKAGAKAKVHRVVFKHHNGYLPEVVRHTCDNRRCCNPDHLLPGTPADNIRDMMQRGRHWRHNGRRTTTVTVPS